MTEPEGTTLNADLPTEAAFKATLGEMAALGKEGLSPINIEVMGAVTTVLGTLPELNALRPEIEAHLSTFDLMRFDKLKQYALALAQANAIHRGTLAERSSLTELGTAATELRDRLFDDARSLANHGLLDAERLGQIKKAPGYRAVATDIFTLAALLKERWPQIEGRTPVTAEALQEAGTTALDLVAAVGLKEQAPEAIGEAQLARQQAFTLFIKAYDDARSAVVYLRRGQGDADQIAPSLYAGRGGRGGAEAAPEAPGKTASAAAPAGGAEPAAIQINNPHNLPIDSPFVN